MKSNNLLIIGILKDNDHLTVIGPDKSEHKCVGSQELYDTVDRLMRDKSLPQPSTEPDTSQSQKHKAQAVRDFEEKVERIGAGIGEYVTHEYGQTLGNAAAQAVTKGTTGFTKFLRRISRP